MKNLEMTRQALYALVWERPLRQITFDLDIDYEKLKAACVASDIPLPPPGYWSKVAYGKAPAPSSLSPATNLVETVLLQTRGSQKTAEEKAVKAISATAYSRSIANFPAPARDYWHPIVFEMMEHQGDGYGTPYPMLRSFHTRPRSDAGRRVFALLNAIIPNLESHGFQISRGKLDHLVASSKGVSLEFRAREKAKEIRVPLERNDLVYRLLGRKDEKQLQGTGIVELVLRCWGRSRTWTDNDDSLVGDRAPEIVLEFMLMRDAQLRSQEREKEEQSQEEQRVTLRRSELQAALDPEQVWKRLRDLSTRCAEYEKVSMLLTEVQRKTSYGAIIDGVPVSDILDALRKVVDQHNPLELRGEDILREIIEPPS